MLYIPPSFKKQNKQTKKTHEYPGVVVHPYNPNYWGG
jgi:hypothetical protein